MTLRALQLRAAEAGDVYSLWLWANDAETRRASFGRGAIAWSDHVAWFERQQGGDGYVFIGEADGQPIGSVRFDSADGWRTARLSYVVAPESRGQGWSRSLVLGGVERLEELRPGAKVMARVMPDNSASLRVFRGLGWSESADQGDHLFVHPA